MIALAANRKRTRFSPRRTTDELLNRNFDAIAQALGDLDTSLWVSVGALSAGGVSAGGAGGLTLNHTYAAGNSQADQTMTLLDSKAGTIYIDASQAGFTSGWYGYPTALYINSNANGDGIEVQGNANNSSSAQIIVFNTTVGTAAGATFAAQTDVGAMQWAALSSGFTPGGGASVDYLQPNSGALSYSGGSSTTGLGISIVTSAGARDPAGAIRLYTSYHHAADLCGIFTAGTGGGGVSNKLFGVGAVPGGAAGAAALVLATVHVFQDVVTSGSPTAFRVNGGAHTGLASAEASDVYFNLNRTVTFGSGGGTIATQRAVVFEAVHYDASAAMAITDAATVAITGGTTIGEHPNVTITRSYAIWVQAGVSRFGGTVQLGLESTTTAALKFCHASSTHPTTFTAGNATADVSYTWPTAGPAVNGYMLTATTAGVMSWTVPPTGTVTGTGTATRIAFWDTSSSISSNSALYWDNTNSLFLLSASHNDQVGLNLINSNAGASAYVTVYQQNDGGHYFETLMLSSASALGIDTLVANGCSMDTDGPGGMTIASVNAAGVIRFYTGGSAAANRRMTLTAAGVLNMGVVSSVTGKIAFANSASANLTTFQAGNATAAVTYTLPTAAPASVTQPLLSTTAGAMSFGGIASSMLAAYSGPNGMCFLVTKDCTAGAAGAADDVTIGAVTIACKIVDAYFETDTGVALSTVTVRDATGGGGTAYTSALASTTGAVRSRELGIAVSGTTGNIASGTTLYLRRSDRAVAGTIVLICMPT